jgi:hypothetical protein
LDSSIVISIKDRRRTDWPEDHVDKDDEPVSFEDVKLNEETHKPPTGKKRGLFARFGIDSDESSKNQHNFLGRKRAQSGQGAELGSLPKEAPMVEVVVE